MFRKIVAVVILLSFYVNAKADYVAERKAALALSQTGKYTEALAMFTNMAAGAYSDFQKSDALEQAASCANGLKQYDLAMNLAKQIPLAGVSKQCRMSLLRQNRKYSELIAEFKEEDIEHWPAAESVIGYGLFYRGAAYSRLKGGQAAEADLKKAMDYFAENDTKAQVLLELGNNYRNNLKDNQKAVEAYTRSVEARGAYRSVNTLLSAVDILREQGKYGEALKLLATLDINKISGNGRGSILAAYGENLAAQGNKTEAIAKFNEALAAKEITADRKELYSKKIKELQDNAK